MIPSLLYHLREYKNNLYILGQNGVKPPFSALQSSFSIQFGHVIPYFRSFSLHDEKPVLRHVSTGSRRYEAVVINSI